MRYSFALAAILISIPTSVQAQMLTQVAKSIVSNPTTYAVGTVDLIVAHGDWKSSQVFFANGWIEKNPNYTLSGRPYDMPISYAAGNRKVLLEGAKYFSYSLANNAMAASGRYLFTKRYPTHRKLFNAVYWAQTIAVNSYLATLASKDHLPQWRKNIREAKAAGY